MGFLSPLNLLWLAGSIALLLIIYLRSRARMTVEVSSLMLFEGIGAPVIQRRMLRLDALFWLEAATLSALSLALAGLYLRVPRPIATHRTHALVFDLGAAMGAREGSGTRLDAARVQALAIVGRAPAGTRFSVVTYALGAHVMQAASAELPATWAALGSLHPAAVAPRPAALKAALIRAREATLIDLFTDRPPPPAMVADVIDPNRLNVHLIGAPAENLAVVSLDPGTPGIRQGHCVIRSFAQRPMRSQLTIESDRGERLSMPIIIAPGAQAVVPFGPLAHGGLVHAHLGTRSDALGADDDRWAYVAPGDAKSHALVLSPDPTVRDDLSRILLGINQNLTVAAFDPAQYSRSTDKTAYELIVMHDTYIPGLQAPDFLLIYPPAPGVSGIKAGRTLATVELEDLPEPDAAGETLMLGQTRELALPAGSEVLARSAANSTRRAMPLAAILGVGDRHVGVIAFDVRKHLLMNPDDLEALLLTVQVVKRLTAPEHLQVVNTASYVRLAATGAATLTEPGGSIRKLTADGAGQIGFMALATGRYRLSTQAGDSSIYANYFNEQESDLTARPATASSAQKSASGAYSTQPMTSGVMTLGVWLAALAMLGLLVESFILSRDWWSRRVPRHV
jgi:Aerotolerance regulator N-terminal